MSILARDVAITKDQRAADKIASLERRIAALERARASGIQRSTAFSADEEAHDGVSGYDDLDSPEITLSIPDDNSLIIVYFSYEVKGPGTLRSYIEHTPGSGTRMKDATAYVVSGLSSNFSSTPVQPYVRREDAVASTIDPETPFQPAPAVFLPEQLNLTTPVDLTLKFQHLSTTGTGGWRNRRLTGIVI